MGQQVFGEGVLITYSYEVDLADNETLDLAILGSPGKVRHIAFMTEGALGSSLSFDILDGGTGTGTDVIVASTDNLNGEEEKGPADFSFEEMADGDVLRMLCDNITPVTVRGQVTVRHSRAF